MSLIHNFKQHFKVDSSNYSHPLSSDLALFYSNNNNPSQIEIDEFAKEVGIDCKLVNKYIRERRQKDRIITNLIHLKYGKNYVRPSEELIKDYERKLEKPNTDFGLDINDILMENIPKKLKKPEFQVIHHGGINDAKSMSNLVTQMKKENKIEGRLSISSALSKTDSDVCLTRFNQMQGAAILADWISDYKDKIESEEKVDQRVYDVLTNILSFAERLPISMNDLKSSRIGKKINKLGKCISDKAIKLKCEFLVEKWKRMIEDLKIKKKDKSSEIRSDYEKVDVYKNEKIEKSERVEKVDKIEKVEKIEKIEKVEKYEKIDKVEKVEKIDDKKTISSNYNDHLLKRKREDFKDIDKTNKKPKEDNQDDYRKRINYPIMQNFNYIQPKSLKKGILKKNDVKKDKRIRIKWEPDSKIEKVKIFKLTDEPNAQAVSEDEYQKIQIEILKNPNYKYLEDMRLKEVNMEKENMSKAREKTKITKDLLLKMTPQILIKKPFYDLNLIEDTVRGTDSVERQIVNSLIQKILGVTYFRDSEIPECPKMGASELFNFTDESIPKIENIKRGSEKTNDIDFDNIANIKITPELLSTLTQKIQNKEFSQEQSNKILAILKSHLNNNNTTNTNTNTEPSNNIPNNQYMYNNPVNINPYFNYNNIPMQLINPLNNLTNSNVNLMDPKRLIETKMNLNKFRTKPCRNYHGPNGCMRGDNCHFIHDPIYAGQDIPNFNLANYRKEDEEEKKVLPMPFQIRPNVPMMPGMRPSYPFMPGFPYYMNPGYVRPPQQEDLNK